MWKATHRQVHGSSWRKEPRSQGVLERHLRKVRPEAIERWLQHISQWNLQRPKKAKNARLSPVSLYSKSRKYYCVKIIILSQWGCPSRIWQLGRLLESWLSHISTVKNRGLRMVQRSPWLFCSAYLVIHNVTYIGLCVLTPEVFPKNNDGSGLYLVTGAWLFHFPCIPIQMRSIIKEICHSK